MPPSMRKLLASLVLPLLMLLAQQGAVWHEVGHLARPAAEQPPGPQQPAGKQGLDRLCESCLACAHLAFAARAEAPVLALAAVAHAPAMAAAVAFIAADAPSACSRGPPAAL